MTRVIVQVQAGILPGEPDQDRTRSWSIDAQRWDQLRPDDRLEQLALINGQALGYAGALMLQPDRVNWVRTEWIWP